MPAKSSAIRPNISPTTDGKPCGSQRHEEITFVG
jgi:hypothetical protein